MSAALDLKTLLQRDNPIWPRVAQEVPGGTSLLSAPAAASPPSPPQEEQGRARSGDAPPLVFPTQGTPDPVTIHTGGAGDAQEEMPSEQDMPGPKADEIFAPSLEAEMTTHMEEHLFVYDDATGKPLKKGMALKGTPRIGRGRNLAGKGISPQEMLWLFSNDVRDAKRDVRRACAPWFAGLPENHQAVLEHLCLWWGIQNLTLCTSFLRFLEAGETDKAAQALVKYKGAKAMPERAHALAEWIRKG